MNTTRPRQQEPAAAEGGPAADTGSAQVFEQAAEVFALLGTPLRLRILNLLCRHDMDVGQLRQALGGAQPSISQNLAALYRSGVLTRQRKGTHVIYGIHPSHGLLLCDAVRSMVGTAAGR